MCDSLLLAHNWSQGACVKLSTPNTATKAMVRDWFAYADTSDKEIDRLVIKLRDGFKKVVNLCNSNRLVFSDDPLDRNSGGWKDWAFVYSSESIDVVYLQNAFLKSGNGGQLWRCALTIIHEITHRELKTDDYRYDTSGLKPGKGVLSLKQAINNADSWAYFATDLAGNLSTTERVKVLV